MSFFVGLSAPISTRWDAMQNELIGYGQITKNRSLLDLGWMQVWVWHFGGTKGWRLNKVFLDWLLACQSTSSKLGVVRSINEVGVVHPVWMNGKRFQWDGSDFDTVQEIRSIGTFDPLRLEIIMVSMVMIKIVWNCIGLWQNTWRLGIAKVLDGSMA